jgi:hypothetical protein
MQKKKILNLAMLGLLFCAGCTEDLVIPGDHITVNVNAPVAFSVRELYADATVLSETVAAKDPWNISTDGNIWCTLYGQPVPNAAKDSVEVKLNITRNDTGETRVTCVFVSYNVQSENMVEIGITTIAVIQKPEFEPEE